ncbi:MAG: glycosyltransferase, partial [Gemmatimonadaceae bacterium]|nr:glycosyltransferase [Gemmatimonadaceae bacterium]
MVRLAAAFASQGDRVDLILVRAFGPYLEEVAEEVRIVELGSRGVLHAMPKLVRYLRSERPHIVMSTLPHANIALVTARALARTGTPVVVREASTRSFVRHTGFAVKRRVTAGLVASSYRHADATVAVSAGVADDLLEAFGVNPSQLHVIHNPVIDSDLEARARVPLDDPWFASDMPPVIMSVGRLSEEKDFPTLLRALARVRERRTARLLLLGEGSDRPRLERLVQELGIAEAVRLPGFVANPYPYMARASVYVLSSQREGLPSALIQAMACGCPVVSTDCPSGPAEILLDGELGELIPVGDV